MRRIVRDYIAAALDRAKPELERYIAERLEIPEPVPLIFVDPTVSIQEIRHLKIAPRFGGDFPPVDVAVGMRVAITARTRRRGEDLGAQTFTLDVQVNALGTAQGHEYDVKPQGAWLISWWGDGQ